MSDDVSKPRTIPRLPQASDRQEGGDHYKNMKIQPGVFCQANRLTFWESCVIKRMCRHKAKNGVEDLRKAIHEIEMIIEMEYTDHAHTPNP